MPNADQLLAKLYALRNPPAATATAARAAADALPTPDAGTRAKRTILEGETPDAAFIPPGCRFHPRCPVAFDRCRVEEPPLFDLGAGQSAACWLVEDAARAVAAGVLSAQTEAELQPP